jgi:hypothetical protein
MNELEEWKFLKRAKKDQCKLSSHCFMDVCLCLFALRITRANSTLKRDMKLSTLGSSLLKNHAFLFFWIDQHITMMIPIANGLLMALLM